MATLPDYYEVLQVSPNAEAEIIQAAYRRLAQKWHPDRRPGDASAPEQMKLLNEAYEFLFDAQKRREYDLRRKQSATSGVASEAARQAAEQGQRAEAERKQEEEHQRQETERSRQEQERHKRESVPGEEKRQAEAALSDTIGREVEPRIAVAVLVALVCYAVLGIIFPFTSTCAFLKMVGVIAIGVGLLRWAKAGSRASRNFRAELIWAVVFAVDGGLGIAGPVCASYVLQPKLERIKKDASRLGSWNYAAVAKAIANENRNPAGRDPELARIIDEFMGEEGRRAEAQEQLDFLSEHAKREAEPIAKRKFQDTESYRKKSGVWPTKWVILDSTGKIMPYLMIDMVSTVLPGHVAKSYEHRYGRPMSARIEGAYRQFLISHEQAQLLEICKDRIRIDGAETLSQYALERIPGGAVVKWYGDYTKAVDLEKALTSGTGLNPNQYVDLARFLVNLE